MFVNGTYRFHLTRFLSIICVLKKVVYASVSYQTPLETLVSQDETVVFHQRRNLHCYVLHCPTSLFSHLLSNKTIRNMLEIFNQNSLYYATRVSKFVFIKLAHAVNNYAYFKHASLLK